MKKQLLDRDIEIKDVIKIIDYPFESNKIILLTGISGVGKSGLVEKLTQSSLLDKIILSVKVSKSSIDTIENQQYFNAIYKTVTKYAKNKTFDKVLSPAQQGVMSLKNFFRIMVSIIKNKLGINESDSWSEPEENESIVRKKDYLIYILNKNNIILDIENVQNIDTQSLEILKEIICETTCKTFIFEYTFTKDNYKHYQNLYKELRDINSYIWCYRVEKMDFQIAKKLAPQNIPINDRELNILYDRSEGNLMEIILASENTDKNVSNIDVNIKRLSKNEKYILYLVFLYNSPISYDELATMIVENEYSIILDFEQTKDIIESLCNKNILIFDEHLIKIKHDSISDILVQHMASPILYYAYTTLKNYLNKRIEKNQYVIEKLLSLYLKFSDQDLLMILPKVKQFILNIKYPDLIVKKLDFFREHILNLGTLGFKGVYYLTLMLVEVCVNKKMGETAQKNLDLIYDETNEYHIALQAQIYSLQENMEAHDALNKLIQGIPSFNRLRLICEICLLYLKTKLHPFTITKAYGEELINNISYQQYTEYAFLLRNFAELCDETTQCTELYLKSIEIFKSKKMYHEMASVYISLSMINAYIGNIGKSYQCIKYAEMLDKRDLSLCYILNNKAVLEILKRNYTEFTEKKLRNSLLLSVSRYERLIINSNLMIYYCLIENFNRAKDIADAIETSNYLDFNYEELLHIIYQDLYYFYSVFGHNQDKLNYYYNQILLLINDPNTRQSTKLLASGMNHLVESEIFYTQFPYRVDFLGYWEFTIDSNLNH